MKSNSSTVLVIIAIIAVFAAIYFLMVRPYTPTHNWVTTLDKKSESPYGAYYLHSLIHKSVGESRFTEIDESVSLQLPDDVTDAVYIFVGKENYMDSLDLQKLGDFVRNGNDAFISSQVSIIDLLGKGFIGDHLWAICVGEIRATSIKVNLTKADYEHKTDFYYQFLRDTTFINWTYFDTCELEILERKPECIAMLDSSNYRVVEHFDNIFPNLIRVAVGNGHLYMHANPIMFTNYYLVKDEGFLYANQTFGPFAGKKVYWDEASKTPKVPKNEYDSFLRFVFSKPGLLWGWYVLLAGVLLFLLFRTKRMQKIIPLLPEKQNHSAEFIKSVAMLYKTSGNHKQIAAEMMHFFQQFVKNKYNYRLPLNQPEKAVEELSEISKVDTTVIAHIIKLNMQLEVSDESENSRLRSFNENLEKFYKNCK